MRRLVGMRLRSHTSLNMFTQGSIFQKIYIERNQMNQAAALLDTIIDTRDPEVFLALCATAGRFKQYRRERKIICSKAKARFQELISQHELGFADHAVEFYLGTNQERDRTFELAYKNLRNRPTLSAFEAAYSAALSDLKQDCARALAAEAFEKWGSIPAYKHSIFQTGKRGEDFAQP